jgi:hypothetical protein
LVAQKAARGKDKRVKLWDHLLANSHPTLVGKPLPPRVQRVRSEYLKAPSVEDEKQWEKSIATAIQEEARQTLHHRPKGPTAIPVPPSSTAPAEKSIAQLISEQNKMKNLSEAPLRRRKGKEKSGQSYVCVRQRPSPTMVYRGVEEETESIQMEPRLRRTRERRIGHHQSALSVWATNGLECGHSGLSRARPELRTTKNGRPNKGFSANEGVPSAAGGRLV